MKIKYIIPLVLFVSIFIILWKGLQLHPTEIPSPLIDKKIPNFVLPSLLHAKKMTEKNLLGHVTLLNVWATWCEACAEEHGELLQLAKQNPHLWLLGLDYKDNIKDAKKWLQHYGNPYHDVAVDAEGTIAIDWGVYGTPETFVIDRHGIIRDKLLGPITPAIWQEQLAPLIAKLQSAA